MYVTSATDGLDKDALAKEPHAGEIFKVSRRYVLFKQGKMVELEFLPLGTDMKTVA